MHRQQNRYRLNKQNKRDFPVLYRNLDKKLKIEENNFHSMKFFSNNSLAIITVKILLNLVRLASNWNDGMMDSGLMG
jgi:hypothetical protein